MPDFSVLVTAPQLAAQALNILEQAGGWVEFMDGPVSEAGLPARLAAGHSRALVLRGSWPVGAAVPDAAPGLKIIAKNGTGVDSVALDAARQRGVVVVVVVVVAADAIADAVAEHAPALRLALTRDLTRRDHGLRQGHWAGTGRQGRDFRGSVLGNVGCGSIGRGTARGALVDETALVAALRSGNLAGAGLDSLNTEPVAPDHPLPSLENLVLMPHVAGVTRDAPIRVATMTARNVVDGLAGRTPPRRQLID